MDLPNRADQISHAFQSKIFALHWHNHAVGAAQAVKREQRQRGRAVNQHKIVFISHLEKGFFQLHLTLGQGNQFNISAGQIAVGSNHCIAATGFHQGFRRRQAGLGNAGFTHQHFIHRQAQAALVNAGAHRGIALRVQVNHQHPLANFGKGCGQSDCGSGFADATFLVGYAKNMGHMVGCPELFRCGEFDAKSDQKNAGCFLQQMGGFWTGANSLS